MKPLFEIRSQFGLARCSRINFGQMTFSTPHLLFPNEGIFTQISTQVILDAHLDEEKFIGMQQEDPLDLLNFTQLSAGMTNPISLIPENVVPIFFNSPELFGTPKNVDKIQNKVIVLRDNYPNRLNNWLEEYNRAAIQTRFDLYEQVVFTLFPNSQFILDVQFTDDSYKLDLVITFLQKHSQRIVGIQLTDIFRNLGDYNRILEWIIRLKKETLPNLLWIVSGQIFPQDYELAVYLGFDLIDCRTLFLRGAEGLYIGPDLRKWLRELVSIPCICSACGELRKVLPTANIEIAQNYLIKHNLWQGFNAILRIRSALDEGIFRNLIEQQIHSNPMAAALLRQVDKIYGDYIASRVPLIADYPVKCIGVESYVRPEIKNYLSRLKTEITPGFPYRVVILLPCAAKKPYSLSKSHQKFIKSIRKGANTLARYVHEVIITSPIGVVPRELEEIFPIQHYDIPVTGDWDSIEIDSTASAVLDWLQKYSNSVKVIAHVTGGYKKAAVECERRLREIGNHNIQFPFIYTINSDDISPQTESALQMLEYTINEVLSPLRTEFETQSKEERQKSKYIELREEDIILRAIADYQFGKGAGDLLISRDAYRIRGKNPIYDTVFITEGAGKIQIGNLFHSHGFFKLSPLGAQLFYSHAPILLKINGVELKGTTVFRPILDEIAPNLHPGDEVLVINSEGRYLGVGELIIAPKDAMQATSGWICTLRKKIAIIQPSSDDLIQKLEENLDDAN
jgi:archaeosine synthase